MSKIDEFIEILELHPSQITDVLIEELGLSGIFYPKETILEDFKGMLEQLRPLVELGEMVSNWEVNYDNTGEYEPPNFITVDVFNAPILQKLIKQIKEQK
jgi:hypothetical protein